MPLRDHFKLTKVDENTTKFNGKLSIFPRPNQDANQLTAVYNHVLNEAMTQWPTVLVDMYNKSKQSFYILTIKIKVFVFLCRYCCFICL